MAKIAKNEMTVKGTLKEYTVTWTYEVPVKDWSVETLVANIEQGLKYAIRRNLALTVLGQEKNLERNSLKIEKVKVKYADKPEVLAEMLEFFADEGVVTEVQTEFVIKECDYKSAPVEPENDVTGVTQAVEKATEESEEKAA